MNNFDPAQHPRVDDGTFAEKFQSAPETPEMIASADHLQKISDEAGYGAIMPEIFSVIHDREEVTAEQFAALTADDVEALYFDIDKGVTAAQNHLLQLSMLREPVTVDESKTGPHLEALTKSVGLSVMKEVFDVMLAREELTHQTMQEITDEDVVDLYDSYVSPAIDKAESTILDKE